MSTGRSNVLDALPRASLLTYFRNPPPRMPRRSSHYRQRPPPPYSKHQQRNVSTRAPLLPRIPERPEAEAEGTDVELDVDEEAQCGFWGEGPKAFYEDGDNESENGHGEENERCAWHRYDIVGILCYALLILVVVLNLDMFLSNAGLGTGMVNWSSPGQESTISTSREMHFCRSTFNREAPTSRVWRVMAPSSLDDCSTQIFTLNVDAVEEWKLLPDDEILLGEDHGMGPAGKFIEAANKGDGGDPDNELGDDLAEEGTLGVKRHRAYK